MSGRTWLVGGVLAVAVTIAGSVVAYGGHLGRVRADSAKVAPSSAKPEAARLEGSQDIERLRAELAQVQGQLLTLRDRVDEPKMPEAAAAAAEPEKLDPETLRARREEGARRWKEHMSEVATAFEQETHNHGFATTAKGAVDRAIQSSPVLQKLANNVDCRSRTCRVEIHDGKSPDVSKQLPIFLQSIGRTLSTAQADYVDGENGQKTAVLYLTNDPPDAAQRGR
jgi:hypothetical protein